MIMMIKNHRFYQMNESIGNLKNKIDKKLLEINSNIVKLAIHDFLKGNVKPLSKILEEIAIEINKEIKKDYIPDEQVFYSFISELKYLKIDTSTEKGKSLDSYRQYLLDTIDDFITKDYRKLYYPYSLSL